MTQLKLCAFFPFHDYCYDPCCGETAVRSGGEVLSICGTWRCRDVLAYRSVCVRGEEKINHVCCLRDVPRDIIINNKIIFWPILSLHRILTHLFYVPAKLT